MTGFSLPEKGSFFPVVLDKKREEMVVVGWKKVIGRYASYSRIVS
jgi:hypothetical protein